MDEHRPPQDNADWPYSSLLVFGFFGADTPGGKRLVWQTTIALLLVIASSWALTGVIPQVLPAIVWVVADAGRAWAPSRGRTPGTWPVSMSSAVRSS
jgi:hypothetical protein